MLVLTRCVEESIIIGKDIEIKVTEICRGRVKLGITAPRHISIMRKELLNDDKKDTND